MPWSQMEARLHVQADHASLRPDNLRRDVHLVNRLKTLGRFVVLPSEVTISARRYLAQGILRTSFIIYADSTR